MKVNGHGGFRKRLIEMGFIADTKVKVVLNAPLKDPIEYEILGYKLSLRREEAGMIEVLSEEEAQEHIAKVHSDRPMLADDEEQAFLQREMEELAAEREHVIRVALVGNPNCGKTSLFNIASGSHEHVGNYSGVTVDAKEGRFEYGGYKFVFVDLPGTYSLSAYSPEELFVRKSLLEQTPDVVLNVVDASNIERNLYLTSQLIDMNLRMVVAMNMFDELTKRGDEIDLKQLGYLFGVPLCPTVCRTGKGVKELLDTVIKVYEDGNDKRLARHIHINHGEEIEKSISRIQKLIKKDPEIRTKYSTRYLAIKYLEDDSDIEKVISALPNGAEIALVKTEEESRIRSLLGMNCESAIVDAKYGFIRGALAETYKRCEEEKPRLSITDKIDAVVTNKWAAFPIFIILLYIMFQATFTLGQYPMDWIDWLVGKLGEFVGVVMKEGWLKDLMVNGVIAGVGGVLVFLPNILILYFFISLMEDSGYMARAAFIVDKLMHKMGLHGKSFIPMVMGFGCNVPAIMATRTIESRKNRLVTIAIIPFMACAGRLPIFVLLAGAFFPKHAALVLLGTYLLGIVLAILSALLLSRFIKDDDLPFVMELPPYRVPTGKAIWRHTWEKGKQYLQKMATIILLCSIIIWFLGFFPRSQKLIDVQGRYAELIEMEPTEEALAGQKALELEISSLYEEQQANSLIGRLGKGVAPVLDPLGFNWRMDVGLLTGIAAKELVVSTLGVMYSQGARVSEGDDLSEDTALQAALVQDVSPAAALAFIVFILLYFPCVATFVAVKNETGRWRWAIAVCAYTMLVAWVFGFLTYTIAGLFL